MNETWPYGNSFWQHDHTDVPDDKVEETYSRRYFVEYKVGGKEGVHSDVFYTNEEPIHTTFVGRPVLQFFNVVIQGADESAKFTYFTDDLAFISEVEGEWTRESIETEEFDDE